MWFKINKMKITVPFKLLSLQREGYHLLVKVKVNKKPVSMIIDTGASRTVFDKERVSKLLKDEAKLHDHQASGLGTNRMQTYTCVIDTLEIGKLQIKKYTAGMLDLTHVNHSYKMLKLKPVDGVVGGDLLKKYKTVIDYGRKRIIFDA